MIKAIENILSRHKEKVNLNIMTADMHKLKCGARMHTKERPEHHKSYPTWNC